MSWNWESLNLRNDYITSNETQPSNVEQQLTDIFHGPRDGINDIFLVFVWNVDCRCLLELPQKGSSNEPKIYVLEPK